jgi:hypothetical protein
MSKKIILILFLLGSIDYLYSQDTTSVLFIGNSFTFYNNTPGLFKAIAESKGKTVYTDTAVTGGKDLKFHSNRERTYMLIKSRKWDYIVLQGHSNEFAQPDFKVDSLTYPYAKKIIDSIRTYSSCSRILFYMTWGYKNGNQKWKAIASYDSMQYRIERQYLRFADKLYTGVSPVGIVWKEVRETNPEINLYQEDRFHPVLTGSYLSACTFYTTIFGETPYKNTAMIDVDPFQREVIELAATRVVLNNLARWRYLPKQRPLTPAFDIIQNNDVVQFNSNAKNHLTLTWDFGDGTNSTENNPSHQYKSKGDFTIIQTLQDNCKTVSLSRKITIK